MNLINGTAFRPSDWTSEGTPIVRIQNLNNENATFNRYSGEIEPRFYIRSGDFLISWSGTPGTSFGAFIWNRGLAILNQHIFRCELVDGIFVKEFLRLAVNARLDEMISRAHGAVGLRHITKGKLQSIPLPVPPLAEQKRIVAKVDELMALCDWLETKQQERETRHTTLAGASMARFAAEPTRVNLNFLFHKSYTIDPADLRKSILTLAVRGKLVPQDSNDEPVEKLLERTLVQRQKLNRTKATSVRLINGENALAYDIPTSWRWQTFCDILIFGPTNGVSPASVDYETPVRSLTLSATTSGRFKSEHSKFIAAQISVESELWLQDGDVLVQRGNTLEYVGVAAVYRGKSNLFIFPDLMMKCRVASDFEVGFVHLAMSQEAARDFLRARASGTSGTMPKINQTTLKSLPLPIPPLAEQRRIVAKVNQLMALVDQLEAQLAASHATSEKLLEALVAELTSAPQGTTLVQYDACQK
jgi:type I restriction enzyme S subunit